MGLLQARVADISAPWKIESAGTWAIPDQPAASNTRKILLELGQDISDHHSRIVTLKILWAFNLILVMERGHKEALRVEFPQVAGRVYLLSEMIDKNYEIDDPVGGSLDDYRSTARLIERILDEGFETISRLSSDPA